MCINEIIFFEAFLQNKFIKIFTVIIYATLNVNVIYFYKSKKKKIAKA